MNSQGWEGEHLIPRKRNKSGVYIDRLGKAERTADGFVFDSKAECGRYHELKILERIREISDLQVHVQFPIEVNGQRICVYEADFVYQRDGKRIVEDVKGAPLTALYRIKKKLVKSCLGIDILEIR